MIVTRDLADSRPLRAEALRRGTPTYGLVCVPARFPLNLGRAPGALFALIERYLEERVIMDERARV